jgi:hypothetical protein
MPAPVGNKNAAKAKIWTAAIERALERRKTARADWKAIDELADVLIGMGFSGDLASIQEIGNRLEGKPAQIIAGDADLDPIVVHAIQIRGIDP